jgi:uncharacterized phiE125 gp8 family phage protein
MRVYRPTLRQWTAAQPPGLVLTLAELRDQCRIDAFDEDLLLMRLVRSAVEAVERWTQRLLAARACTLTLPGLPAVGEGVELPGGVVQSITSIVARTAEGDVTMDLTDVEIIGQSPAALFLKDSAAAWPEATRAVVTYVAGYPAAGSDYGANVPADLLHAVALIAADLYQNREHSGQGMRPVSLNAEWLMAPHRIAPVPYL